MSYDGSIKIDTKLDSKELQDGLGKLGGAAKTALKGTVTAIGAVSTALVGAAGWAVKTGMDFESGMSEVQAISRATGSELEQLKQKAMEMGAKTKFSASESADAFQFMAQAGWGTQDMLDGIEGVMNLAAASGEDLALTSNIVTDSLTAFGLKASDSAHFADVLAMAANASNTSVADMGETFKYVAPVAGALGYSVEDMSVAIGLMANSGIKGSQAGTALRATLSRLAKPTKESSAAMEALGLSLTDSSGQMKPFNTIMEDMRAGFSKLTPAQKANYAAMLGGQEAMSGLLAVVNAGDEDFAKLTEQINNADGAALEAAAIMQDNLKGQVEQLGGALETLGLQFYNSVENPLKDIAKSANGMLDQLSTAFSEGGFDGLVSALGNVLAQVVTSIAESAPSVIEAAISLIQSFISGIQQNLPQILQAGMSAFNALIDGIKSLIPVLIPIAVDILTALLQGFIMYQELLWTAGIEIISGLLSGMADNMPELIPMAQNAIMSIANTLLDNLPTIINSAMQIILALALGLADMLPELIPTIIDIVLTIVETLIDNVDLLIDASIALILGLTDGLLKALPVLIEKAPTIVLKLMDALVENAGKLVKAAVQLVFMLSRGVIESIPSLIAVLPQLIHAVYDFLMLGFVILWEVGKNIVTGIWDGISQSWNWLLTKLKDWCGSILDAIKGWFGIHSPSRVMRDEVGKMIVEGVAVGIKENAAEVPKEFQKMLNDLQLNRDLDIINDAEYYTQLEKLRDAYLEKGSEEWWKYTKDIMGYEKKLVEQQKKDIIDLYSDIATEAGKKIDEILQLQEKMESKLKGFGNLYGKVKINDGKNKSEIMVLRDLSKDVTQLQAYKEAIQAVRKRGASQEFMSILKDMSVEEGTQFANTLLGVSDADFNTYLSQWQEKQQTALDISKELYQEETDGVVKYMKEELEKAGLEVPEGFFDNGKSAAENFGEGFVSKIDEIMTKVKSAIQISMQSMAPTISFAGGVPVLSTVSNTYSKTYNVLPSSGESTAQQLQTIAAAEKVNEYRSG